MNYWIFVSLPYTDFNRGSISEMAEKIRYSGKWAIGRSTVHRNHLSQGDKVLFYQAGRDGMKFVGTGQLLSALQLDTGEIFDHVAVGDLDLWDNPVPVEELLDNLSFVRNKQRWGFYFKGGVIRLAKSDYDCVVQEAKRRQRSSMR